MVCKLVFFSLIPHLKLPLATKILHFFSCHPHMSDFVSITLPARMRRKNDFRISKKSDNKWMLNYRQDSDEFHGLFVSSFGGCVISSNRLKTRWAAYFLLCLFFFSISISKNTIRRHRTLYNTHINIYTYKICWMYKKEYSCTLMHIAIWLFQSWLSYHSEISNAEEMQTMHTMFIHSWHTHKRIARHEHTIFMCNRTLSLLSLSAALSFHWTTTTLKPPLPAWSFFSSSSLPQNYIA